MTKSSNPRSTPLWVWVFGAVILLVLVVFVITLLAGVQHGPGLHAPSG